MNFDQTIDRNQYPTFKWHKPALAEHFGNEQALPFWVADMDFPAPDAVVEALRQRAEHGIFGYEYKTDGYFESLIEWYQKRHQWTIGRSHIEFCPGVLNGVAILIDQHSDEGDGVIIQPPVFFEFRSIIRSNKRKIVKNPLKLIDSKYHIDLDDLAKKSADPKNKILILCNPHNPIGRVWTREELDKIGEICCEHNVFVISDELHGDIVYPPHRYIPFASRSVEVAQNSATCISPAKTFNIAGIVDGMVVIPNDEHRQRFHDFGHRFQTNKTNVFASAALAAGYRHGGPWLDELLIYLQGNIDFIRTYLRENIPQVTLVEPEGTYLAWLNFAGLGLEAKALEKFLAQEAQLALNAGYWFGREGAGFARMNIACPRSILTEAFDRLAKAVRQHI